MLKWAGRGHDVTGAAGTSPGELALKCPSCPHPGINLPDNWAAVPDSMKFLYAMIICMDANFCLKNHLVSNYSQDPGLGIGWAYMVPREKYEAFLYAMIICMDANFRVKNQLVSNYSQDPGLGIGWAYMVPREKYEAYVLSRANDEDVRIHFTLLKIVLSRSPKTLKISTCVGFQALAKANTKFLIGLRYTGLGLTVCGCSEMIFPVGVGNLQKGERYANMDYIFGMILQAIAISMVLISYDICCQWFINLFKRIENDWPPEIKPPANVHLAPAIPKLHKPMHTQDNHHVYSLNFIPGVGLSDCECPERVWAPHNPLANAIKTQGPSSRQDTLDDHFGFWNWLKYVNLGATLL
ncbi:hypothetical protein CVT25_001361 [Psilocybe cyanescens]|uniref:CxC2-like cysteine cluster KDZ transposase-associated domain-containing protein n=1 Tax=Psilocybe cyanescens TaxID=93625 RepID=A0A409XER6_PSICY|nr:hypothetical protein CVT25_001361 [Psilocybe cyanescens]